MHGACAERRIGQARLQLPHLGGLVPPLPIRAPAPDGDDESGENCDAEKASKGDKNPKDFILFTKARRHQTRT